MATRMQQELQVDKVIKQITGQGLDKDLGKILREKSKELDHRQGVEEKRKFLRQRQTDMVYQERVQRRTERMSTLDWPQLNTHPFSQLVFRQMAEHGMLDPPSPKDKAEQQGQRRQWLAKGGLTALVRDILKHKISTTDFTPLGKTYSHMQTLAKLRGLSSSLKGLGHKHHLQAVQNTLRTQFTTSPLSEQALLTQLCQQHGLQLDQIFGQGAQQAQQEKLEAEEGRRQVDKGLSKKELDRLINLNEKGVKKTFVGVYKDTNVELGDAAPVEILRKERGMDKMTDDFQEEVQQLIHDKVSNDAQRFIVAMPPTFTSQRKSSSFQTNPAKPKPSLFKSTRNFKTKFKEFMKGRQESLIRPGSSAVNSQTLSKREPSHYESACQLEPINECPQKSKAKSVSFQEMQGSALPQCQE